MTAELTEKQITANRRKVVRALRSKKYAGQCFGSLFGETAGNKCQRCALGVAATVLMGLKTYDDYRAYIAANGHHDGSIYKELSRLLGIPTEDAADSGVTSCETIYTMNDTDQWSFPMIADELAEAWGL